MVVTANRTRNLYTRIYTMRQSGSTLQQIADTVGKTKERIRQILVENCGSTKHQLISTEQLCQLTKWPRNRILELHQTGVIEPATQWHTNNHHFYLWPSNVAKQVVTYYDNFRLCRICFHPIGKGRRIYCSQKCYAEGSKYKYQSIEAKHKHIRNVQKYREKRKQESNLVTV